MMTSSPNDPLETSLGQLVDQRSTAAEAQGHLTDDVVAALHRGGVYRQWIAPQYGGAGLGAVDGLDRVRWLSTYDGAAGWCAMIAATTSLLSYFLPIEDATAIYGHPEAITGGFAAPRGFATSDGEGNFVVKGTWQWGSGSTHCTHIGGGCAIVDRDGSRTGRAPFVFFDRSDVDLLDTWQVSGLSGTGSTDYRVHDLVVPESRAVDLGISSPVVDAPIAHLSFFGILAAGVASVCVGIAQRTLDELVDLAGGKTPQGSTKTLANRQTTQLDVAKAEATITSAWLFLTDAVEQCRDEIERVGENSVERRVALRLAATHAAQQCGDVVRELYLTGGGEAVYRRNALQKQFRDIHVATQHAMIAPRTYELAGRIRLGLDTDTRTI